MKRKIFIGSSTEGSDVAEIVKKQIESTCSHWLQPVTWCDSNVFNLNQSTLHSLIKNSRKHEYGIFVATRDDNIIKRGKKSRTMRDNVLFELGLFLGSLGYTRTFLIAENNIGLPNDYAGITISFFDKRITGSLENKVDKIIKTIERTKDTFNIKMIPSTGLAYGYYENYILPLANLVEKQRIDKSKKLYVKIPQTISDIDGIISKELIKSESKEVCLIKNQRPTVYKSEGGDLWDIPKTLKTLNDIVEKVFPTEEFGANSENIEIIEHEIRNFEGTLSALVSQKCLTSDFVVIESL